MNLINRGASELFLYQWNLEKLPYDLHIVGATFSPADQINEHIKKNKF